MFKRLLVKWCCHYILKIATEILVTVPSFSCKFKLKIFVLLLNFNDY